MCIAVPAEVVSIDGATALVDVYGKRFVVSLLTLSEPVEPGDYVAVMAQRYAMSKIAREDAVAARRFLEGVFAELADGDGAARVA
ncbi:MAG: HypC/HybG/HupF family hydrogenase formation chaperone [Roseiarcus sp.]